MRTFLVTFGLASLVLASPTAAFADDGTSGPVALPDPVSQVLKVVGPPACC